MCKCAGPGETGKQPASTNAAAGLKEPEARLYECIKWMLIGSPHFLPLVELLLLSSLPLFVPPSHPVFKHKCHIPTISYLLCWQPLWPVEDSPRCNLSTPGGGLFTQCWLGAPRAALMTSPSPLTFFPRSFFSILPFCHRPLGVAPPSLVVSAPAQPQPPQNTAVRWSTRRGIRGGTAPWKPRQRGCKSVFTGLP